MVCLNPIYDVISFHNRTNNRNSQQRGYSLSAWHRGSANRNNQGQMFSLAVFVKDFSSGTSLWLSDGWIISFVSLSFFFPSVSLTPSFFFPLKHHSHLSSSHPSFLSICALWSGLVFISILFPAPITHTSTVSSLSPTVSNPSICVLSVIWPAGSSQERCCWHDTQVTPWDTQMSTSDAITLSISLFDIHTQLTSNTHFNGSHRFLHQKQYVSLSFTHRHILHFIHTYTKMLYRSKTPTHYRLSRHKYLYPTYSLCLSLFSHTLTRSSPLTSCPRCQKHVVSFLCQQLHIPDRKPLRGVSVASKLNMGDFPRSDKALLCPFLYSMLAIIYKNTMWIIFPVYDQSYDNEIRIKMQFMSNKPSGLKLHHVNKSMFLLMILYLSTVTSRVNMFWLWKLNITPLMCDFSSNNRMGRSGLSLLYHGQSPAIKRGYS